MEIQKQQIHNLTIWNMIKIILNDLFLFLKGKSTKIDYSGKNILWLLIGFCLLLSINFISIVVKTILYKLNLIVSVNGAGSPESWIEDSSLIIFAIQVAILAPILEEFAFRGVLLKNKSVIILSFTILLFLIACRVSNTAFYSISIASVTIFVISFLTVFVLSNKLLPQIINFTQKNIKWLIYLSSVCFALWHYKNFDFSNANLTTVIITFCPYFFSGLVYCWISNRKGIHIGLSLHFINNVLPVLIAINKYLN